MSDKPKPKKNAGQIAAARRRAGKITRKRYGMVRMIGDGGVKSRPR